LLKTLLDSVHKLQKAKSLRRLPTIQDLELHCCGLLRQCWVAFAAHKFVELSDPTQKAGASWEATRITLHGTLQCLKEVMLLLT